MNVVIIYNPNSTGDSKANALQLAKELRCLEVSVTTKPTDFAGHAEQIAAEYAKSKQPIVLVSSSGDGGYHEVINGALAGGQGKLVVGVLPSGNANDHFSELGGDSLARAIKDHAFQAIDTIKVSATVNGQPWVRYAHSYAGIGVTAKAAKRLTEDRPNALTEKWIVIQSLLSFRYVKIRHDRDTKRYSSILFGNISRMSKILKLSEDSSVTDGKIEMSAIRFRSKFRLIMYLLSAATVGLKQSVPIKKFHFITTHRLPLQLDGESYIVDAHSKVTVEAAKQNLRCVL
jgi:diacylglycerol kinase (ATP)